MGFVLVAKVKHALPYGGSRQAKQLRRSKQDGFPDACRCRGKPDCFGNCLKDFRNMVPIEQQGKTMVMQEATQLQLCKVGVSSDRVNGLSDFVQLLQHDLRLLALY